jgi:epoxyqueuosine reductase
MSAMETALRTWADARGYEVAWGPAACAREAQEDIRRRRQGGELAARIYEAELAPIVEVQPPPPEATLVIVAKPRTASRVGFELEDEVFEAILPPTYARYRATFEEVRQDLATHGLPGARVELLAGPLKSTAAGLGLVRYGRNNLSYAPRAGSYIQLCGYVTDARLSAPAAGGDDGPQLLEECAHCSACRRACPTGAIDADRVLLRAERCLTFLNENVGPWPDWAPARAHTCLIGCLMCQRACPVNPKLTVEDTGLCFSAGETRALLGLGPSADPRQATGVRTKLAWLGQPYAEPVLGRNLLALLCARGRTQGRDPKERCR